MTATEQPHQVTSRDGTGIAFWVSGQGPPLVIVHGAPADHTRWRPLLAHLEPHATVYAMDRRGRGASGDGPDYRLDREWEDVAAVIDAAAEAAGSTVDLYGHSFGGMCAYGAVALTRHVRRLVLYEGWPPVDPQAHALPPGVAQRMDELLAAGDRDGAVEAMFLAFGISAVDVAQLRGQPAWRTRVAAAHTITREIGAIGQAPFDPEQAARIAVPTLLLTGSESNDPAVADIDAVSAALPDARVVVIEGQGHLADILAPERFAALLLDFLRGR
jgi:pimeloyl-ACP methyl ester carboxylesterase